MKTLQQFISESSEFRIDVLKRSYRVVQNPTPTDIYKDRMQAPNHYYAYDMLVTSSPNEWYGWDGKTGNELFAHDVIRALGLTGKPCLKIEIRHASEEGTGNINDVAIVTKSFGGYPKPNYKSLKAMPQLAGLNIVDLVLM